MPRSHETLTVRETLIGLVLFTSPIWAMVVVSIIAR